MQTTIRLHNTVWRVRWALVLLLAYFTLSYVQNSLIDRVWWTPVSTDVGNGVHEPILRVGSHYWRYYT
ncbi:hypothetical protein GO755_16435 [Spirosoma sp. HMF4905]|uniref:Uncharacterized protein n=1 Tax=Spirosoma arboris TaxID=2682092 RepID=A0A7K1SDI4_9BACT|nr:hypothetical protein [Spirosoma arboris]MVM31636.1 hypothetical protein [Spirosoma arboris]